MKQIKKVNILAAQIRRATGANRSDSMRQAWTLVKATPGCKLLTFTKIKTKEITTRVVAENWFDFQPPVGGTSTNKPGQLLFADLAKVATGVPCIISTFETQILALVA